MKNSKSNPGLPVSFGRICVLVLMLLCSFGIVSASQQSQAQTFISAAHPTYPANLYYFNAIISQSLTSTLSNTTGIILLPVAANPVDLPSEIWICPSMNFSLNAKDSSNWNVSWDTSLITHTEYIPKSDRACPITLYNLGCGNAGCINTTCNQWSPQSSRIPIFWKASALASQIQAFGIGGNNAFFIHQSDSPSIPYSQFPLNANINVNYYPLYGKPDVYPNRTPKHG